MNAYFRGIFFAAVTASLIGCGGGSDDDGSTATVDFSGIWSGTSGATALRFSFAQTGNNLAITRTLPAQPAVVTYSGVINGNAAVVTTYINNTAMATSTWTKTDSSTISAIITSCTPTGGYQCGAPVGDTVVYKKL